MKTGPFPRHLRVSRVADAKPVYSAAWWVLRAGRKPSGSFEVCSGAGEPAYVVCLLLITIISMCAPMRGVTDLDFQKIPIEMNQ